MASNFSIKFSIDKSVGENFREIYYTYEFSNDHTGTRYEREDIKPEDASYETNKTESDFDWRSVRDQNGTPCVEITENGYRCNPPNPLLEGLKPRPYTLSVPGLVNDRQLILNGTDELQGQSVKDVVMQGDAGAFDKLVQRETISPEDEHNAAVKIQALTRGFHARKETLAALEAENEQLYLAELEATAAAQREADDNRLEELRQAEAERARLEAQMAAEAQWAQEAQRRAEETAATKIQALAKGRFVRSHPEHFIPSRPHLIDLRDDLRSFSVERLNSRRARLLEELAQVERELDTRLGYTTPQPRQESSRATSVSVSVHNELSEDLRSLVRVGDISNEPAVFTADQGAQRSLAAPQPAQVITQAVTKTIPQSIPRGGHAAALTHPVVAAPAAANVTTRGTEPTFLNIRGSAGMDSPSVTKLTQHTVGSNLKTILDQGTLPGTSRYTQEYDKQREVQHAEEVASRRHTAQRYGLGDHHDFLQLQMSLLKKR